MSKKRMGKEVPKNLPENPKIDLKDIQAKIKSLLPNDAILCGHKLNHQLDHLKVLNHTLFIQGLPIFTKSFTKILNKAGLYSEFQ